MKNTVNDANVGGKLDESDKKAILDAVEGALQWLQTNQEASKEEFEHRQKELEGVCNPIMTKMYQGAGAAGGAGGMPDMSQFAGAAGGAGAGGFGGAAPGGRSAPPPSSGPKVEEVD
jgi:L1 cell adhesion molecule like protein